MLIIELKTASDGTTTTCKSLTKTCIKCCLKNTCLLNDQVNREVINNMLFSFNASITN